MSSHSIFAIAIVDSQERGGNGPEQTQRQYFTQTSRRLPAIAILLPRLLGNSHVESHIPRRTYKTPLQYLVTTYANLAL
jgi:hypothetical protein